MTEMIIAIVGAVLVVLGFIIESVGTRRDSGKSAWIGSIIMAIGDIAALVASQLQKIKKGSEIPGSFYLFLIITVRSKIRDLQSCLNVVRVIYRWGLIQNETALAITKPVFTWISS